jgi:hypothetical protein
VRDGDDHPPPAEDGEGEKMKMIDRFQVTVDPILDFGVHCGVIRLRFRISGDGDQIGYDLLVDQNDLTKSVFDHMWDTAKIKVEEAIAKKSMTPQDRGR